MEAEVKITCRAVCTIKRANGEEIHATLNFVPAANDPAIDVAPIKTIDKESVVSSGCNHGD